LQLYRNLEFHKADNDRVICYSKRTPDRSNQILVAVSMDPFAPQEAILELPLSAMGVGADETYQVHELLSGERALWQGPTAQVKLTRDKPAAVWSVLRFQKSEQGFDYYF
jgi:starch synthase (maltosyl-transferring)